MRHFIVTKNKYLPSLESLVQVHPFLDSVAVNTSQHVPVMLTQQKIVAQSQDVQVIIHNPLEHMCTSFANGVCT